MRSAKVGALWPALVSVAAFTTVAGLNFAYLGLHWGAIGQIGGYYWGMSDFRDVVYYPCRAVVGGVNPYDGAAYREHFAGEVGSAFPLYSPLIFVLHAPLALLDYHLSGAVFQGINVIVLLICCRLVVRWCGWRPNAASVLSLAAVVMLSEPCRTNLNYGQVTWPLVLASYCALAWARDRPGWSGMALAVASFKPTYFVGLGFFMLCRGDYRAVCYGTLGAVLGGLAGLGFMAVNGVNVLEIPDLIASNHAATLADPTARPDLSIVRVDAATFLAKVLALPSSSWVMYAVPIFVLLVTGWLVRRDAQETQNLAPDSFATFLICLTSVVAIYHLVYDLILLTLPAAAIFTARHSSWKELPRSGKAFLAAGCVLLALNVFWTGPPVRIAKMVASSWPELFLPWSDLCWRTVVLINPTLLLLMWTAAATMGLLRPAWNLGPRALRVAASETRG